MDRSYEWQHAIIRFVRVSGSAKTVTGAGEACDLADSFAQSWKQRVGGAVNYGAVVFHSYSERSIQESVTNKRWDKVPHLHVIFKYYKGTKAKFLLESFANKEGFKIVYSGVRSVSGLTKYLLQGRGRVLLCETGKCPEGEVCDRDVSVWAEGEAARCEDHVWLTENDSPESTRTRDREDDDGEDGSHPPKKVRSSIQTLRRIESLLMKYRVKDETNLSTMMNDEERDWFDDVCVTSKDWNRMFLQARTNVTTRIKAMKWEDIMEMLPDDPKEYSANTMSINQSLKVFQKILEHQKWNADERLRFVRNMYAVVNNNIVGHKRNTFYMEGEVSAGKTLITKSVCNSVIFAFHTGEYNSRSSDFHFEDMMNARVASLEEPQIEAGKIDKFKVILGGESFDTNVKFKVKGKVDRVPVIISTNYPITRFAREAEHAFEERWYKWLFKHGHLGKNIKISGPLHPKMWLALIKHYGLTLDTDIESDGSEFDFEQFAEAPLSSRSRQLAGEQGALESEDELDKAIRAMEADRAANPGFNQVDSPEGAGGHLDIRPRSPSPMERSSLQTPVRQMASAVPGEDTCGTQQGKQGGRRSPLETADIQSEEESGSPIQRPVSGIGVKRKLVFDSSDDDGDSQTQTSSKEDRKDYYRRRCMLVDEHWPMGTFSKDYPIRQADFNAMLCAYIEEEEVDICWCLKQLHCDPPCQVNVWQFFRYVNSYFAAYTNQHKGPPIDIQIRGVSYACGRLLAPIEVLAIEKDIRDMKDYAKTAFYYAMWNKYDFNPKTLYIHFTEFV